MKSEREPSIVTIAAKYGVIQGVLSFVISLLRTLTNIKPSWVWVALNVAPLIVLMVLAHRELKRTRGMMTYPQGLGSGTLLSSVAAVVTGILAYVNVEYINTGSLAAARQAQQAALEQRGLTGAQAHQAMAIAGAITTPVGLAVTSVISGVILGFIVALIVSIFTQKGDPTIVT